MLYDGTSISDTVNVRSAECMLYDGTSIKSLLLALAVSKTDFACLEFIAMGFSESTCLPALSILIDNSTWLGLMVPM